MIMILTRYPVLALLLVAQVSCADRARELEVRQFKKLPQIRKNVRAVDEYDRQVIRLAEEREAERRRIEKEIHDAEQRRIAEERQEERERQQVARELICWRDHVSEEACSQKASEYVNTSVAAGGCSIVIQQLSTGSVDLKDTAISVGSDMAMKSDNKWVQRLGVGLKVYGLYRCLKGKG